MEVPERRRLIAIGKMPINPLIFWGVITVVLLIVLIFIMSTAGVASGVHWLLVVPVLAYLVIMGFFIGYISKLQKERDRLLTDKIQEEEVKVGESKKLNQELETYAKQLFDKDLELSLANKRLQNLEQAKSKFVSVTTHQLRTPLSAIKWTFHMVLGGNMGPINDDQRNFLQKGYDSTQRMIAIINDLLNVDHIEADRSDYNFLAVDLLKLSESIVFEFINPAESKKIKLDVIKSSGGLPAVTADPIKIGMVLENLVDNAIKYTPVGGRVTIHLSDARINSARSSVEVVVSDGGIGIPPAERDKVFHRFFRGSNAVRLEPNGTGLGLFIARDIIEKHGGDIWFESKEGEGTNFHFTLPVFHNLGPQ